MTLPPNAGWLFLADFPATLTLQITDVLATSDGFVAVGKDFGSAGGSTSDFFTGAVWLSADGYNWEHLRPQVLQRAQLDHVVEFDGDLYATGMVGACFPGADCIPIPDNAGRNVWRSSDGRDWEPLAQSDLLDSVNVTELLAAGDHLVAVGSYREPDDPSAAGIAGVWRSTDGVVWNLAPDGPSGPELTTAVARGAAVAAFGSDPVETQTTAWNSQDAGSTWADAAIDGESECRVSTAATTGDLAVAVGVGRHVGADELIACSWSSDGDLSQWRGGLLHGFDWTVMGTVRAFGTGFLAAGQVYQPETATAKAGAVWRSVDGSNWTEVTQLPELGNGSITAMGIGPLGVVVFGNQFPDLTHPGEPLESIKVWYAPPSALGTS